MSVSVAVLAGQIAQQEQYAKGARATLREIEKAALARPEVKALKDDCKAARAALKEAIWQQPEAGNNGSEMAVALDTIKEARLAIKAIKRAAKDNGVHVVALVSAMRMSKMDYDERVSLFDSLVEYAKQLNCWQEPSA